MKFETLKFQIFGDKRGKLISLENNKNIPFEIKRVYYIFDTLPYEIRGKHAHKNLQQVIIAIHGSCEIVLDDGKNRQIFLLDSPEYGLLVNNNVWREMQNFSNDCKLIVLASDFYNDKDYIRDYDQFLKYVMEKQ